MSWLEKQTFKLYILISGVMGANAHIKLLCILYLVNLHHGVAEAGQYCGGLYMNSVLLPNQMVN